MFMLKKLLVEKEHVELLCMLNWSMLNYMRDEIMYVEKLACWFQCISKYLHFEKFVGRTPTFRLDLQGGRSDSNGRLKLIFWLNEQIYIESPSLGPISIDYYMYLIFETCKLLSIYNYGSEFFKLSTKWPAPIKFSRLLFLNCMTFLPYFPRQAGEYKILYA